MERLRSAHGEPMALLRNHLPPGLVLLRTEELEATGLYRLMRAERHHAAQRPPVGGGARRDGGGGGGPGRGAGAPLLTMERVTYDDTGRVVEFGSHVYRAARYAFEFQLLVRP